LEVVERRLKRWREVMEGAREFARSLEGPVSAILVGSYARGDFSAWSDVDILLIGKFEGRPPERLGRVRAPPGFEVIPLTPEEAVRAAEKGNPLLVEAVERGVVLRDDLGVVGALKGALERGRARRGSGRPSLGQGKLEFGEKEGGG
jgi:predicted nucleotidyltransferase